MIYIEIDLYKEREQNYVYLSTSGICGRKYKFNSMDQLKNICDDYVNEIISLEDPFELKDDSETNRIILDMLDDHIITIDQIREYQHAYSNGDITEADIEADGYSGDGVVEAILNFKG